MMMSPNKVEPKQASSVHDRIGGACRCARSLHGSACPLGSPGAGSPTRPGLLSPEPVGVTGPGCTPRRVSRLRGPSSALPSWISFRKNGTQNSNMRRADTRMPIPSMPTSITHLPHKEDEQPTYQRHSSCTRETAHGWAAAQTAQNEGLSDQKMRCPARPYAQSMREKRRFRSPIHTPSPGVACAVVSWSV